MDERFHELALQADEFQGNHQDGAPMLGTGNVVQVPKSRPLRNLLESDGMSSLAERALGWKAAAPAPSAGGEKRKAAQPSEAAKAKAKTSKNTSGVGFPPVMGVQGGMVRQYLPPQRVPVRPRQRHHLHIRPCRTRRRTRSASTAATDSAEDPATAAVTSTAAPAAAAAAGGRRGGVQQPSVVNFSRTIGGGWGGGGECGGINAGRGGGEPERAGTLFADAGRSLGPRGAPKPGSVSPPLFHGEKERLYMNCSTDSRSWFNSQMPYNVLPQNATTESREVRVSDTSRLTRPTEIQNSLVLAKPAADRAVPCRKSEISLQQNGGGAGFNPNLACTRSVGSPGPDSSSVQAKRVFAAAEEQWQGSSNSNRTYEPGRLNAQG